jgi:hypothetical protein
MQVSQRSLPISIEDICTSHPLLITFRRQIRVDPISENSKSERFRENSFVACVTKGICSSLRHTRGPEVTRDHPAGGCLFSARFSRCERGCRASVVIGEPSENVEVAE